MASASPTLLYITKYYSPTTAAAGIRAVRFIEGLKNRGYRVIVLTSGLNPELTHSENLILCRITSKGQIPDALQSASAKNWDRKNPLPGPDPDPQSIAGFFHCAQPLIDTYRPELLIASAPPFSCAALGQQLSDLYRLPFVLDLRDAWFTGMPWPYPTRTQRNSSQYWERLSLTHAAAVIVVTQTLSRLLEQQFGPEVGKKIVYIPHSFESQTQTVIPTDEFPRTNNEFRIVYTGQLRGVKEMQMSALHRFTRRSVQQIRRSILGANFCEKLRLDWMSPHILFEAIGNIAAAHADFARDLRLVFAGEKFSAIDRWAKQFGIQNNIIQMGPLPPEKARLLPHSADLLLLNLYGIQDCPYHWCVPSKIFEYLGTGKPILSLTPPGEASDIVRLAGTGFPIHPENKNQIEELLLHLYRQHQEGGIPIRPDWNYINQFNLPAQQKRFCDLVDSLRTHESNSSSKALSPCVA